MLKKLLYELIFRKDDLMMPLFFAQRVILGKTKFEDVPVTLKPQVAEILIDSGLTELITEEEYLPKVEEVE